MPLLDKIPNKSKRRKLRAEVARGRELLSAAGVDVSDFSEDEMVATLMALQEAAPLFATDAFGLVWSQLQVIKKHGMRTFVRWCQDRVRAAEAMTAPVKEGK